MFQAPPPPPPQQSSSGAGPDAPVAMLTPDDEERIRIVAARVAGSAHPGKFQMELTERTRYSHHFLFLDAAHPHHTLYQQLLAHFRHFSPEQWQQHRRAEADAVRIERDRRAEKASATSLL